MLCCVVSCVFPGRQVHEAMGLRLTYDVEEGDQAMVIRNHKGDWAVCVARWHVVNAATGQWTYRGQIYLCTHTQTVDAGTTMLHSLSLTTHFIACYFIRCRIHRKHSIQIIGSVDNEDRKSGTVLRITKSLHVQWKVLDSTHAPCVCMYVCVCVQVKVT